MKRIIVTNAKGGVGKSTIATNIASYFADQGQRTTLYDYDPQGSSIQWLKARPDTLPHIHGIAAYESKLSATRAWQLRIPADTDAVIIDTAAGLRQQALKEQTKDADIVLVPVTPSVIDIHATAEFLRDLLLNAKVRCSHTRVGIIANRVKPNTLTLNSLNQFLRGLRIPVVAQLYDSQIYPRASEHGAGLHELQTTKLQIESESWSKIYNWIEHGVKHPVAACSG